jgi:hypothetical protein
MTPVFAVLGALAFLMWMAAGVALVVVYRRAAGGPLMGDIRQAQAAAQAAQRPPR